MRRILGPVLDLLHLLYPRICLACEQHAPPAGEVLCTFCQATLPESDFHLQRENPFTDRLWGRFPLEAGAAMFLFAKNSRVQQLIHNLKYRGRKDIGVALGRKYGYMLRQSPFFASVDVIIPVPLHWKKERIRGYNQSERFAAGLSDSMGVPVLRDVLVRLSNTETQTRKSRIRRLQNVDSVFQVTGQEKIRGKHVLLVDDVLTTGSTLEACALALLTVAGTRVSLSTIAFAEM